MTITRKKLIEVALPLEAINKASAARLDGDSVVLPSTSPMASPSIIPSKRSRMSG